MTEMPGKPIADGIIESIAKKSQGMARKPCLMIVSHGINEAAELYTKRKLQTAKKAGIETRRLFLPAETPEETLIKKLLAFNGDPSIDGIIVDMPLPQHVNPVNIFKTIAPEKDADGVNPLNAGLTAIGAEGTAPCTALAIRAILKAYGVALKGKHCVVVGRSAIVGRPAAALLLREDATVTVAHSKTTSLKALTLTADILVAAAGKPWLITKDMIKPGAVLVDAGINVTEDGVAGDIDPDCRELASLYTPVPGGVGPLTNAMLCENVLRCALRQAGPAQSLQY